VKHRFLDLPEDLPVERLPDAALVELLERGDFDDWRPLVRAIGRDPEGDLAARVARLVDAFPMYGTSALFRAYIERARARAEGRRLVAAPTTLRALRKHLGLTQRELADRLGMTQSDLSKLERRSDVRVSTLKDLSVAVGGRLRILVERPEGTFEVEVGSKE
jgi:DNA-binding Xre family transcriptional regulator